MIIKLLLKVFASWRIIALVLAALSAIYYTGNKIGYSQGLLAAAEDAAIMINEAFIEQQKKNDEAIARISKYEKSVQKGKYKIAKLESKLEDIERDKTITNNERAAYSIQLFSKAIDDKALHKNKLQSVFVTESYSITPNKAFNKKGIGGIGEQQWGGTKNDFKQILELY